jgi:hypothetical protein
MTTNFKLADLTRALIAAGRAGMAVREVTVDGAGRFKMTMAVPGDEVQGPPTLADLEAETAELDRLVAADKRDG